ncbi:glutathione S-transferase [Pseudomonas sp. S35]|uniref:glutathione S-transferase family protein n=1 Tax=Pseudomonas sp. S35 TaxID=1573719 RepID=UPI00132F0673|nr:glutathione S-transferase family protein [Pseudomonas sp. S35]QHF44072.1 glutathione S-transferase [Pseudomonas sp. S35]
MTPHYLLVSHALCPYVQRAAIVLTEKDVTFERQDIDLGNKPQWFLELSPLGKTPVLVVDGTPIFESAVICDYLDETIAPRLHPEAPLERAQHRAWVEFGSALLNAVWAFYAASDDPTLLAKAKDLRNRFEQLEVTLDTGPYFAGEHFSIVDAAFGPVFRYFDVFETIGDFGFFTDLPKVTAWRMQLAQRPSVQTAVKIDYPQRLRKFLLDRGSALSRRIDAQT